MKIIFRHFVNLLAAIAGFAELFTGNTTHLADTEQLLDTLPTGGLRGLSMQRVLLRLLDNHEKLPGGRLSVTDLVVAGWPGERLHRRAGANRVYVAINGLRRRGLGADLESKGGYRLSPAVTWARSSD